MQKFEGYVSKNFQIESDQDEGSEIEITLGMEEITGLLELVQVLIGGLSYMMKDHRIQNSCKSFSGINVSSSMHASVSVGKFTSITDFIQKAYRTGILMLFRQAIITNEETEQDRIVYLQVIWKQPSASSIICLHLTHWRHKFSLARAFSLTSSPYLGGFNLL